MNLNDKSVKIAGKTYIKENYYNKIAKHLYFCTRRKDNRKIATTRLYLSFNNLPYTYPQGSHKKMQPFGGINKRFAGAGKNGKYL